MQPGRPKASVYREIGKRVRRLRGDRPQAEITAALNWPQQKLSNLELGKTRLTWADADDLAGVLGCLPIEFYTEIAPTVPLVYRVCAAAANLDTPEIPAPHERIAAPRLLDKPEECVGAEVGDDSADRWYPKGSQLFVRKIEFVRRRLVPGARVLAAHHRPRPRGGREIFEVLAGALNLTSAGDLVITTASSNPEVPRALLITRAHDEGPFLAEPRRAFVPEILDYAPAPGDAVEILGRIAAFTAPA